MTVLTPSSRHARWIRSAISPRFAMRIFSNIARFRLIDGTPGRLPAAVLGDRRRVSLVSLTHQTNQASARVLRPPAGRMTTDCAYCPAASRGISRRSIADQEQRLTVLDGLAVLDQDFLHDARLVRLDFIEQLHGFDDAKRLAFLDGVSYLHERVGARRRRAVERADHRRGHHMTLRHDGGRRSRRAGSGARIARFARLTVLRC